MVSKTWALIEDGLVKELTAINPTDRYPGTFVWVSCSDSVEVGHEYSNNKFSKPKSSELTEYNVEHLRLLAYADPVHGSDRYLCEAMSLQASGFPLNSEEVQNVIGKAMNRIKEIKLLYPKF